MHTFLTTTSPRNGAVMKPLYSGSFESIWPGLTSWFYGQVTYISRADF